MAMLLDILSNRYFKADIHELAIKERELNFRLAYDEQNRQWKNVQITYNDLMGELFGVTDIQAGECIKFNMPIELEIFGQVTENEKYIYTLTVIETKHQKAQL